MKFVNAINRFLATSIGLLNAVLAVFLILCSTAIAVEWIGGFGLFVGPVIGAGAAVIFCGMLAVLINIRDLLAASADRSSDKPASEQ